MTSFLSRLFGKSPAAAPTAPEPILHNDFRIFPAPIKDGSAFRIAARIEKTIGGETKTHQLIRADTRATLDEATEATILKAKQAIDQLGDTLFG
ncbi:MAG: HlyU family transcriptional regulator [Paracoccaceae bacterium]